MVNMARHGLRATWVMLSIVVTAQAAWANPIGRRLDSVVKEDDNAPTLLVVDDQPPPVLIAVDPPLPPPPPPEPELPARNMLGFRINVGALSIAQQSVSTIGFGLATEARLYRTWRGFADYEWVSLSDTNSRVTSSRDLRGHGHRGSIGLRHVLIDTTLEKAIRFYVDGELGGGVAWTTDNITGDHVVPHGLVGLRFGYDLITQDQDSPSREFEFEFLLRTIITNESTGLLFGIGMSWGG